MASTEAFSSEQGSVEVGPPHSITLPIEAKPKDKTVESLTDRTLEWIMSEVTGADKHVNAFREDARQCYRFFSNKQLDDKDEKALKAAQRPHNAFNTAQKYIRFVSGIERKSPEILIFAPEEEYDAQSAMDAEAATRGYEWTERTSRGGYQRSRCFEDLLITGMACRDYYVDSTSELREKIAGPRVSPLETLWPESSETNLANTRWRGREIYMDPDDVKRRWPSSELHVESYRKKGGFDPDRPEPATVNYFIPYVTTEDYSKKGPESRSTKKLKILEFQWWDEEEGFVFPDPLEGDLAWMEKDRFSEYQKRLRAVLGQSIEGYEEKTQKVYRRIFLLERRHKLGEIGRIPAKRFTLNFMTSTWDEDARKWYGLMRVLIDPQRYANKFFNQMIEIMATQAKGGGFHEEGAIDPKHRREFEATYAKPGSWQMLADGGLAKIREKSKGDIPAASMGIMEFCINSMETVTGLTPGSMGLDSGGNVPIGTMRQRQSAGLMLVAKEFDALSEFRMEEGQIALSLLRVIADGRTVFAGSNPYEPIVFKLDKRIFTRSYISYLDDTANDPTIQAKYSEFLMQITPTLIRMNWFLPGMLNYFKYMPVREREQLKQMIIQQAQEKAKMAAQGIPMGGRGAPKDPKETQAKIQKLMSESSLNFARAEAFTKGRGARDFRSVVQALAEAEKVDLMKQRHATDGAKGILDTAKSLVEIFKDDADSSSMGGGRGPREM